MQGSRYHRYDIDYDIIGYDIDCDIIVHTYDIIHDIICERAYDIIGQCSNRSDAALRRPRYGSGLTATVRRFLVSTALVLLSLSCSALILSASVIDTIWPWPCRQIQMFTS